MISYTRKGGDIYMCLNCGCKMMDDDMGNPSNITLETLAKAALADNNGDANDILQKMKESLEMISPEELQAKIDEMKSKNE
jgi:hypothetical protein